MDQPGSPFLSLCNLRKTFGAVEAVKGINLSVDAGEFVALLGPSGCGKTSTLRMIAGFVIPTSGEIRVRGIDVTSLLPQRRNMGMVFQSYALFPHMTVAQNVQYGLASLSQPERRSRSQEVLQSFHIASLAGRHPSEISGGERQRVALARALVMRPRVLLLDEPLTAIDAAVKARIVDDLRAWNRENEIPILYVTHERGEVFGLGEKVIVLDAGSVVAEGSPHDVLHSPQSETVAQLAGFENIFDCSVVGLHAEQGTMTCRIADSTVDLEVPLTRVNPSAALQVGIRAGDILLASSAPQGLSARNILPGVIDSLHRQDAKIVAQVRSDGVSFQINLTLGAMASMHLQAGLPVWLVIKTYSCQLLQ